MDGLIKLLRVCAERDTCIGCPYLGTGECDNKAEKAADVIEKLQKTVLRLEDESGILDELPMYEQPVEAEWPEENTCSHCGEEACAGYDEEPWRTRYCPHCGAKMKNPEEYK